MNFIKKALFYLGKDIIGQWTAIQQMLPAGCRDPSTESIQTTQLHELQHAARRASSSGMERVPTVRHLFLTSLLPKWGYELFLLETVIIFL